MSLPEPTPGLVIRYAFLWSHEAQRGDREGSKERSCVIIVATKRGAMETIRITVAPITHKAPTDKTTSLELPSRICRHLGLDEDRHWVRFDELNSFEWPGFDLRTLPGQPGQYTYGRLPEKLFETIRQAIIIRARAGALNSILNRDDE